MITRQSEGSKPITISQAVQKMNRDRPTIHALQKAGRAAKRRRALMTPQDNEDHKALVAQWEAEIAVGTAREQEESLSNSLEDELGITIGTPLSTPRYRTLKGK